MTEIRKADPEEDPHFSDNQTQYFSTFMTLQAK